MFNVIRRWVTAADPVHFAGWCGEVTAVLSDKLTHTGGTTGDREVVDFCDEHFGTMFGKYLSQWIDGRGRLCRDSEEDELRYIEDCQRDSAEICEWACEKLRHKGITVVDEYGHPLLDENHCE